MKKVKKLLIIVIALCLCAFTLRSVGAETGKVATSTLSAWKFAGGWETTSSFVDDGVKVVVPGASSVGSGNAWSYKAQINNDSSVTNEFSIADGKKLTLELSVGFYDTNGNIISKSQNSAAVDIYIYDAANMNSEIALLRIWTDSAGVLNGSHSVQLYGPGWSAQTNPSDVWILGDATLSSSFYIEFDKENLISAKVAGKDEITRLDDSNNTFLTNVKDKFANVENLAFRIGGENGFTNDTEIVVRAINGQSLASSDGYINDTVAPTFDNATVAASLTMGEAYEIPLTAYDLFSGVDYSMVVGDETISGKTFTPTTTGEVTVTLVATDAAGNKGSKDLSFNVVSNISAPTITDVPVLTNKEVLYFETLSFEKPTYLDETGAATVALNVYRGEELIKTIEESSNNTFDLTINSDFVSGAYTFEYAVTNSAGTTLSEQQTINLTVEEVSSAEFVTPGANVVADYVDSGIRVRTTSNWTKTSFGVFDLAYGLDVKFIVNQIASNNKTNGDGTCVELILTNVDNPDLHISYRVWCKFGEEPDAPTNVYIYHGSDFRDIENTGWISLNVDGVKGQYHMAFNFEETFVGERLGGMQRVDNAYEALQSFLNEVPSTKFDVSLQCANLGGSGYYEFVLSEINGQSFASTAGVVNKVNDAILEVENLPTKVQNNDEVVFDVYAKDIFTTVSPVAQLVKPDGTLVDLAVVDGKVTYQFVDLGTYKVVVSTVGTNGVSVKKEVEVVCKSSILDIELTLPSGYNTNYGIGEELTVLEATYSDNVVTKIIEMKKPDGSVVTLNVGDKFTFATSGIYVLTYIAKDNAEPTPNEKVETLTINVADTTKPVVTVTVSEEVNVNDSVTPTITVVDDSEYDVTVTLTKPDGSVEKLSGEYAFTVLSEGTYTLKVVVEDIYGNVETVVKEVVVNKVVTKAEGGCGGSVIASIFGVVTLALGFAILRKKREE